METSLVLVIAFLGLFVGRITRGDGLDVKLAKARHFGGRKAAANC